ncbi:pseudaminic acid cytidylyltransferase [Candidatus Babeliales bacterium]|nr:pseudaminic acid cytidylyltransferase [Candidatus Babeliales bacterium]
MSDHSCVAIIPARGGSKRIPRKNIKSFLGQPIISYSIQAALQAGCFDEVMVSTDDAEIAGIAKNAGAQVPFIRSAPNADDHAMLADVIEEVLLEYQKQGKNFTYFCCILPTAPFVSAQRLKEGFAMLTESKVDSVVPVVRFSYPVQRAVRVDDDKLSMLWPENYNKRSQDLEPVYHDCGQFYFMKSQSLLEQKQLFAKNTMAIKLSELEVQDIDSLEDWKIAELKYRVINNLVG